MQFFKRFSVFTAAASLTACGAYFVETDILKAAHFEGALTYGAYLTEDSFLKLKDGPDTHDIFCSHEDGDIIKGDLYTIPTNTGVILIGANVTEINDGARDDLTGGVHLFCQADRQHLAYVRSHQRSAVR